ncbi:TetR/AcrR family transcriptional regulator [Actinomadura sp. 3N508]|uniref:TetR/AcrR family transcriptional regulator n=1 Tax=Actinomadura sp. 3N508 TaxID=3375153 RepID=UPI0037A87542
MAETVVSPRERYRAQVRTEIKDRAWEQIATAGASALSLNAIAKQMGMSGPALYRYFANRDELITELIRDAYRSLADAFHATAEGGTDLAGLAETVRRWAFEVPHRYFLIYGTPIPGYQAPPDTAEIAGELMAIMLDVCAAAPGDAAGEDGGAALDANLDQVAHWGRSHPARVQRRALTFWTRLHGVLSLELAGHFGGMAFDPALLYEAEVDALRR